ncbi:hypothetical protein FTO70_10860 [Methanosarcina sp. KYL-1]|uniref:hypothetical protein n=1 Tax=Methanosarcina sp. KYL-1 TaxID=2602068 RepID=UPI0021006C96|nr:hypothetical protein [Methanosarcina sp. KYL-1]MCQ1536170.1 hypothetical protein [Methanosarcina sp. KYL-1]
MDNRKSHALENFNGIKISCGVCQNPSHLQRIKALNNLFSFVNAMWGRLYSFNYIEIDAGKSLPLFPLDGLGFHLTGSAVLFENKPASAGKIT